MAGKGPTPKVHMSRKRDERRRLRGDFVRSTSIGWQDGEIPEAPPGVSSVTRAAWRAWMSGWVAPHWTKADLPALHVLAVLYDQVEGGDLRKASELRYWLDTFGLTPKGAQDRRWLPPADVPGPVETRLIALDSSPYSHLRADEDPGDE